QQQKPALGVYQRKPSAIPGAAVSADRQPRPSPGVPRRGGAAAQPAHALRDSGGTPIQGPMEQSCLGGTLVRDVRVLPQGMDHGLCWIYSDRDEPPRGQYDDVNADGIPFGSVIFPEA